MDVMIAIIAVWPIASVVIGAIDFPAWNIAKLLAFKLALAYSAVL